MRAREHYHILGKAEQRGIHDAGSADYMQGTRVSFRSKEDAIHFSEKQGIFSGDLFLLKI